MADFTLDTSGFVYSTTFPPDTGSPMPHGTFWRDLSPFEQGCIEALLLSLPVYDWDGNSPERESRCGFSDLSPEALEVIRKDCARFAATPAYFETSRLPAGSWGDGGKRNAGAAFWRTRNGDEYDFTFAQRTGRGEDWPRLTAAALRVAAKAFPPLTIFLSDAGKVCLREAG